MLRPSSRREFLQSAAAAALAMLARPSRAATLQAVAFDAFPVLDPRPVFALAEDLFPGKGAVLSDAWRSRQFEYQWLRALSGGYADFWRCTEDALVFAAGLAKVDLTAEKRERLMYAYLELHAWPDAAAALRSLRERGLRLAFLSNATPAILEAGIRNSNLEGVFEHVLSTDAVRTFKPDPRAYRMALDAFGLRPERILFVAFAGWDAAGAKRFGFPTYWMNRLGAPAEALGAPPDAVGAGFDDLRAWLSASASG